MTKTLKMKKPENNGIECAVYDVLHIISPGFAEKYTASAAQFVKFGVVGLSNTIIGYVINVLALLALKNAELSWDYIAANIVSFLLSVLWSFYWNSKYVFDTAQGERVWWKALLKTYLSYAFTGILLNNVLSWIWIEKLHVSKYVAPLINLIVSVPINFVLNKFWAFKPSSKEKT